MILKTQIFVDCPRAHARVNINGVDGCRYCQDCGPVSMTGKTQLILACKYGQKADTTDSAKKTVDAAAQTLGPGLKPHDPGSGLTTREP